MAQNNPSSTYQANVDAYTAKLNALSTTKNRLAWLRLITVIVAISLATFTFPIGFLWGWITVLIGIAAFLFVVSKDQQNKQITTYYTTLLNINQQELLVLQHQFQHRFNGDQFNTPQHGYANDLDIFGNASIFQYLNRCQSQQGIALLAEGLLAPIPVEQIKARQQAATELSTNTQWQQHFQAIGMQHQLTLNTEQKLISWLANTQEPLTASFWKYLLPAYIFFTTAIAGCYLFNFISSAIFSAVITACLVFAFAQSKKVMKAYASLNRIVNELEVVEQLVSSIELATFTAPALIQLQQGFNGINSKASTEIKQLKQILNRFDVRLNVYVFLFLNTFFLWDVWQIRALHRWKKNHRSQLKNWLSIIAEMEVINTLSILAFNHTNWCTPVIADTHFVFAATSLGHPLLMPNKSVTNHFSTQNTANITLITGSNMAGKSTFLRSIGCNTVLALMGANVCAESFSVSHVQVRSSMRIADNLAENTSTFYAELKILQQIITAVNNHEKVFILLDEILRGTNSLDRHTGSKALMKQLIKKDAVALLATHDIALAEEAITFPNNITNYHFDVQVENEELFFDYKLKTGICKSMNASILMRKIGIEMEPDNTHSSQA